LSTITGWPQSSFHALRQKPRRDIGRTAGREWHDDVDRAVRIILRVGGRGLRGRRTHAASISMAATDLRMSSSPMMRLEPAFDEA
jgi:hypothetical protein